MLQQTLRALPLALLVAACGGGGGDDPAGPFVAVKWTPSGDLQTDTVNQTLPLPIRVKVTRDGQLMEGIAVHFDPGLGGGQVGALTVVTGSNGIAATSWKLPQFSGVKAVTVTVDSVDAPPLVFHATAIPGTAKGLVLSDGDGQVGDTMAIFGLPFTVQVVDTFANGIPGRWVYWDREGGLTLATDSLITDADGLAKMFATAGKTVGPFTVTATVDGLAGSPVQFNGEVVAPPIRILVGNNFYNSNSITVPAGAQIKWVWTASNHSVTSTNTGGSMFTGSGVQASGTEYGPITFATPGVYTYQCSVHGAAMQGTITVN